ncbi:MAG TPA: hypothetical protein VKP30_20345 [Polyangiaceae bacterium]|nr:hypothetical protein [Polyangiaceae bacterium]
MAPVQSPTMRCAATRPTEKLTHRPELQQRIGSFGNEFKGNFNGARALNLAISALVFVTAKPRSTEIHNGYVVEEPPKPLMKLPRG